MIQSLPYQFEPELSFTLLRNAIQSLILILSHRNCHAWSYTKTNMHQSAIYRTTNGYMFRIPGIPHRHGQISTPYEIQKYSAQKQACVSLKQKERKLYEPLYRRKLPDIAQVLNVYVIHIKFLQNASFLRKLNPLNFALTY